MARKGSGGAGAGASCAAAARGANGTRCSRMRGSPPRCRATHSRMSSSWPGASSTPQSRTFRTLSPLAQLAKLKATGAKPGQLFVSNALRSPRRAMQIKTSSPRRKPCAHEKSGQWPLFPNRGEPRRTALPLSASDRLGAAYAPRWLAQPAWRVRLRQPRCQPCPWRSRGPLRPSCALPRRGLRPGRKHG